MLKKLLLLVCVAFAVVCYAYPCFILPFGTYSGVRGTGESKVDISVSFGFNGKAEYKQGNSTSEKYYKLEGNKVILSDDDKFDNSDIEIQLTSMYKLSVDADVSMSNNIGMSIAIGVGALAVILILLPSKRR